MHGATIKVINGVENVGVFIREKVWLENSQSQSEGITQKEAYLVCFAAEA
jgi:hypothetical protein